MPKQARRDDKYPFDGLNRAAIIFDGDNVRNSLKDYGWLPPLDLLVDWISNPDNLGIDKVVCTCLFLTVPHVNTVDHLAFPVKDRNRFCEHLYVRPRGCRGYHDNWMYREALRLAPRITTLVIVSSDGGADGGTYKFASELRRGFDRFARATHSRLATEVVCISSHLDANADWRADACNSIALEDIFPDKLMPKLADLRPYSAAVSA